MTFWVKINYSNLYYSFKFSAYEDMQEEYKLDNILLKHLKEGKK